MNYEQMYKDALERAKNGKWDEYTPISRVLKEVFPELEESEDERIRKDILAYLKGEFGDGKKQLTPYTHEIPKWYAWLEKQGEQPVIYDKDTYNSAKEKSWGCKSFNKDINNKSIYIEGFQDGYQFGVHEEKPHRWTLHDEAVRKEAIACLLEWKKQFPSIDSVDYDNIMTWLKDELSIHIEEKQCEKEPVLYKEGDIIEYNSMRWTIIGVDFDNHCYDLTNNECVDFDTAHYAFKLVEQKSAEWSEEDEENLTYIKAALSAYVRIREENGNKSGQVQLDKARKWLDNRFKKLLSLNSKQEWSEEDNVLIENICIALNGYAFHERTANLDEHACRLEEMSEKLKSLRPQPKQDHSKWLEKMKACCEEDKETGYINAVYIMCDILTELGYKDVADEWRKLSKGA